MLWFVGSGHANCLFLFWVSLVLMNPIEKQLTINTIQSPAPFSVDSFTVTTVWICQTKNYTFRCSTSRQTSIKLTTQLVEVVVAPLPVKKAWTSLFESRLEARKIFTCLSSQLICSSSSLAPPVIFDEQVVRVEVENAGILNTTVRILSTVDSIDLPLHTAKLNSASGQCCLSIFEKRAEVLCFICLFLGLLHCMLLLRLLPQDLIKLCGKKCQREEKMCVLSSSDCFQLRQHTLGLCQCKQTVGFQC